MKKILYGQCMSVERERETKLTSLQHRFLVWWRLPSTQFYTLLFHTYKEREAPLPTVASTAATENDTSALLTVEFPMKLERNTKKLLMMLELWAWQTLVSCSYECFVLSSTLIQKIDFGSCAHTHTVLWEWFGWRRVCSLCMCVFWFPFFNRTTRIWRFPVLSQCEPQQFPWLVW